MRRASPQFRVGMRMGCFARLETAGCFFTKAAPCAIAGRVSMDLIGVAVTHLPSAPEVLDILGPDQTIDDLAEAGGTIGYEILTSLGARYKRDYLEGAA